MNNGYEDKIDLSQFDDVYQATEAEVWDEVPDGKYKVNVDGVEIIKTKETKKPMLKWTLRIIDNSRGQLMWKNSVISDNTIKLIKQDLTICGLILSKLSDLPDRLKELLDIKLEVAKQTKGENSNIYFKRKISLKEWSMDEMPF